MFHFHCVLYGLTYIVRCIHCYSIMQSIFTALKILCVLPSHPSLSLILWQPLVFLLPPLFSFSHSIKQLESYSSQSFQMGFFHFVMCNKGSSKSFDGLIAQIFGAKQYSIVLVVLFSHQVISNSLRPMDCSIPGFPVRHQLPELIKRMSIESVMPSNHLILCCPLLLLPSIFPSIRIFSKESALESGGQSIGASASASVLPMNIQD